MRCKIYFVRLKDGNYKIGRSKDVSQRFKQLEEIDEILNIFPADERYVPEGMIKYWLRENGVQAKGHEYFSDIPKSCIDVLKRIDYYSKGAFHINGNKLHLRIKEKEEYDYPFPKKYQERMVKQSLYKTI